MKLTRVKIKLDLTTEEFKEFSCFLAKINRRKENSTLLGASPFPKQFIIENYNYEPDYDTVMKAVAYMVYYNMPTITRPSVGGKYQTKLTRVKIKKYIEELIDMYKGIDGMKKFVGEERFVPEYEKAKEIVQREFFEKYKR